MPSLLPYSQYYCLLLYPIQSRGRLEIRTLLEQAAPGGTPDAVSLPHNGLFIHRAHDTIAHQPVAIDHNRLHITALPLVHKTGDDPQQRYQVRLAQIDHDQVGFVPRCEPTSIWYTEGLIAMPRGPQ